MSDLTSEEWQVAFDRGRDGESIAETLRRLEEDDHDIGPILRELREQREAVMSKQT